MMIGFHFLMNPHQRHLFSISYWRNVLMLSEAMRLVATYYVDEGKVSFDQLTENAMAGMLSTLDAHSAYLSSEGMERLDRQSVQQYVGIGVEIQQKEDWVVVMGVFPESGAAEAGVEVGDRIVSIEGESVEGFGLEDVVERLRGENGTRTSVTFVRGDPEQRLDFSIERRSVNFPSLRDIETVEPGIVYCRLTHFGGLTSREFAEWVEDIRSGQYGRVGGVILDLRRNPGGGIVAALETLDLFVPEGALLLSTKGREVHGSGREWMATQGELFPPDIALVVLVDRYSASAAEILAGALQDFGRATIVGETTVGKGSVQSVFRFGERGGFKLTTSMYSLPSGRTIHGTGIKPDLLVEVNEDEDDSERDVILEAGLEQMRRMLGENSFSVDGTPGGD